ncbi:hypothetical protein ACFSTA_15370 [Ornithinibacillus salinisoli]|uniref:DUF3953 domain-containing protein n=1 Tax=Ornithinibacillus salinisoli TaxID=1848459 RepID=A0ABW4W0I2_9BACI
MRRITISVLWISIVVCTFLLISLLNFQWGPLFIFILFFMGLVVIGGIATLIKAEKAAHIPLLLGIFLLCCLCTALEINHFFLISFLFFIGLMIYFISFATVRK